MAVKSSAFAKISAAVTSLNLIVGGSETTRWLCLHLFFHLKKNKIKKNETYQTAILRVSDVIFGTDVDV